MEDIRVSEQWRVVSRASVSVLRQPDDLAQKSAVMKEFSAIITVAPTKVPFMNGVFFLLMTIAE